MATYTENYNLIQPAAEDYYSVEDFNGNMDTIDGVMAAAEEEIAGVSDKIGTPATAGATLFSLLEGSGSSEGVRIIKSLQHIVHAQTDYGSSASHTISSVTPENCIVLFQRLLDDTDHGCDRVEYTLSATKLSLTFDSIPSDRIWDFYIIEFY